jgi:hypothetical protein
MNNLDLQCIQVDDVDDANNANWNKDIWTEYSEDCTLGIYDFDSINIGISPNPVLNRLTITTDISFETAKIYNLQGQLINEVSSNTIDVSKLTSGLYFVHLNIAGQTVTKKFIKE